MATKGIYKCPICGQTKPESEMIKLGSRHYCIGKCANEKQQAMENDKWRKVIIEYLMKKFGLDEPNLVWLSQMKRYVESGMKMQGCFITLKYMYEKLHLQARSIEEAMSLVPNYYSKAKEDYMQDLEIRKNTRKFMQDGKQPFTEIKIILTKEELERRQRVEEVKAKKIDLSTIDIDEED